MTPEQKAIHQLHLAAQDLATKSYAAFWEAHERGYGRTTSTFHKDRAAGLLSEMLKAIADFRALEEQNPAHAPTPLTAA